MSAHVLLILLNELGNEFNKFNDTRARMLDSIKNTLKSHFWRKKRYIRNVVMDVITFPLNL